MKDLYKLNEARQQQRLDELATGGGNVSDLSREIILARCLLEDALNAKNNMLANTLLLTISKLCQAHDRARYRAGELLEKSIVLKLATKFVDIFADEFSDYDDAADRIDRASQRLALTIEAAKNDGELVD